MRSHDSTTSFIEQPLDEKSRAYLHDRNAAVGNFILQAAGVFGFFAVSGIYLSYEFTWDYLMLLFFSWVLGGAWFILQLLRWNKAALNERKYIHQEPVQEDSRKQIPFVRVKHPRVNENNSWEEKTYDLPGTPYQLRTLAKGVLGGREFTEDVWAGKGKLFGARTFRALRQKGLAEGLFEYVNEDAPNQGIDLTPKGEELFQELADNDLDEYIEP